MRMKRTLFSIVLLAALAVQGLYAQATREEIFNDIATTGGVYYAYPFVLFFFVFTNTIINTLKITTCL